MHQYLKQIKHSGRAKARWAFEPARAMQFADNVKRDKLVKQTLKKQRRKVMDTDIYRDGNVRLKREKRKQHWQSLQKGYHLKAEFQTYLFL